jgi:hypothetical protein
MEACHAFLVDIQPQVTHIGQIGPLADRIELLRREIELRRNHEQSERHHQENRMLGRKTLFWAKLSALHSAHGSKIAVSIPAGV